LNFGDREARRVGNRDLIFLANKAPAFLCEGDGQTPGMGAKQDAILSHFLSERRRGDEGDSRWVLK